jgi:hypothetical protein
LGLAAFREIPSREFAIGTSRLGPRDLIPYLLQIFIKSEVSFWEFSHSNSVIANRGCKVSVQVLMFQPNNENNNNNNNNNDNNNNNNNINKNINNNNNNNKKKICHNYYRRRQCEAVAQKRQSLPQ